MKDEGHRDGPVPAAPEPAGEPAVSTASLTRRFGQLLAVDRLVA